MSSAATHPRWLETASDSDLLRHIQDRRQEALGELYDRYASLLLGLAHRVLGSRADAEEVVQEILTYIWENPQRYDPGRSSVSTWLSLIVRSRAIDRLRSTKVVERTHSAVQNENPLQHTSPKGVENVLSLERQRRVQEELGRLPEEQRRVLELAFYRGMTQSEIAEKTGIPLGTVKTRTLLAMKKLRTALRGEIKELL